MYTYQVWYRFHRGNVLRLARLPEWIKTFTHPKGILTEDEKKGVTVRAGLAVERKIKALMNGALKRSMPYL
jgi:hypothetical protein